MHSSGQANTGHSLEHLYSGTGCPQASGRSILLNLHQQEMALDDNMRRMLPTHHSALSKSASHGPPLLYRERYSSTIIWHCIHSLFKGHLIAAKKSKENKRFYVSDWVWFMNTQNFWSSSSEKNSFSFEQGVSLPSAGLLWIFTELGLPVEMEKSASLFYLLVLLLKLTLRNLSEAPCWQSSVKWWF